MKRLIINTICLLLFPLIAVGQTTTHKASDKSLIFSFDGAVIDDYKYGIGGKYWTSYNTAITASFLKGSNTTDIDTNSQSQLTNFDSTTTGASISALKHFYNSSSVSPYFGIEAQYSTSQTESSGFVLNKTSYLGINAIIGVEYFVNDSFSFAAEYYAGTYKITEEDLADDLSIDKSSTTGYGIGSSSLHLLFYF